MQDRFTRIHHLWMALGFTFCFLAGGMAASLLDRRPPAPNIEPVRIGEPPSGDALVSETTVLP